MYYMYVFTKISFLYVIALLCLSTQEFCECLILRRILFINFSEFKTLLKINISARILRVPSVLQLVCTFVLISYVLASILKYKPEGRINLTYNN